MNEYNDEVDHQNDYGSDASGRNVTQKEELNLQVQLDAARLLRKLTGGKKSGDLADREQQLKAGLEQLDILQAKY